MFYTIEKITNQLKEIKATIDRDVLPLHWFKMLEMDFPAPGEPDPVLRGAECPEFDDRTWQDFEVGQQWGGYDRLAWFRTWVELPQDWKNSKLAVRLLVGPRDGFGSTAEAMLYVNGVALQGIDVWHTEAWLPPETLGDGRFLVAVKAWSGVLEVPPRRCFKTAEILRIDETAEAFYFLAENLLRSIQTLAEDDLRRWQMLEALNHAFHQIDFLELRSPAYYASLQMALQNLQMQVAKWEAQPEVKPVVTGIGHAHIDVAWLWRVRHSREKAARTFTTALHLMRQYADYRFMHSTPQVYAYIKEDYPELYLRIKEKIASGAWEITGGMWVEADTNIPSGESLVRQFLHGKRFVRDEFGVEMKTLWLPDVFGYSASLPQIIKKSGLTYFLTSKISWSQFNRFPYDTFLWRGIDGSEVLTQFVTTPEDGSPFYTYNGRLDPQEVSRTWKSYQQKDLNDELITLFGWGDGGGGPTREMLESARALKNMPGLPRVQLDKAENFLDRLAERVNGKDLPTWDGELYLEYHRGTYTSQAENKRSNRLSERLYHDAEWLSTLSDLLLRRSAYPAAALHKGWELILLNQFHDILPGSSIHPVYEDSHQDYLQILEIGEQALQQAETGLLPVISSGREGLVVFNSLSWERTGLIELPWSEALGDNNPVDAQGQPLPMQFTVSNGKKAVLLQVSSVPSLGYQGYLLAPRREKVTAEGRRAGEIGSGIPGAAFGNSDSTSRPGNPLGGLLPPPRNYVRSNESLEPEMLESLPALWSRKASERIDSGENGIFISPSRMENTRYRLEFNNHGQIVSLWDKPCERELISQGKAANVFQAFEDKPMKFDAWDIDIYYQEKMLTVDSLLEAVVEENGPLRGTLRFVWSFGRSTITQRISLYSNSPRIDFRTQVDWHEAQVLLKVAFPLKVRSTRATYDIQFGNIERPTHNNTSWDIARFEAVGHKWVDLSEGNYGVSLLNDCKYGHDIHDNVIRLTLIKSAIYPDPQADKTLHHFTYSLLPHPGDWRSSETVPQAYDLNFPLRASLVPRGAGSNGDIAEHLPSRFSFAWLDSDNVILETLKRAEEAPHADPLGPAWIVRVYEYKQYRGPVALTFALPVQRVVECNLVEDGELPVDLVGNILHFSIAPYEIKTFKVWFGESLQT